MTLFMFLFGTAVCVLMSRFNEDDALFWKLWISFIGAFMAGSVVRLAIEDKPKQDNVVMIEKAPTQVLQSMPCSIYTLADISLAATRREKSPKPVSKDSLISQSTVILSEVLGHARGQPHFCMYYDDS